MSGSNDDLIDAAALVLNPHRVGERLFGDVGSTLVTDQGNQFSGVCIDTRVGDWVLRRTRGHSSHGHRR